MYIFGSNERAYDTTDYLTNMTSRFDLAIYGSPHAAMVPPHGGVVCHEEAHIEMDEGGAPGFYLHGAKLMLAQGEGAKLTPQTIAAVLDPIRDDVHQVQPHAISITQASEYGRSYRPEEIAAIAELAHARGLRLHMDGARFANAAAFLDCTPAAAAGPVDALSFGFIKNGAMSAEAIVFFDPALADVARYRRKRAGHLQSKGRFLAAQLQAMLEDDIWLANARHANAAAAEIGTQICEVHTGPYAEAFHEGGSGQGAPSVAAELERVAEAGRRIRSHGIGFNAGHGLNYVNVGPIAALNGLHELHIGHSIVSRAVFVGLREAVREMKALLD